MTIHDIDRLIVTREPIMIEQRVCRLISFTIVWTPRGVDYVADVLDGQGKRYRARLSDLTYLDGRRSV